MSRTPHKNFWQRYTFDMLLLPFATALVLAVWAVMDTLLPL